MCKKFNNTYVKSPTVYRKLTKKVKYITAFNENQSDDSESKFFIS